MIVLLVNLFFLTCLPFFHYFKYAFLADQVAGVPKVSLLGYYIRRTFKPHLSLAQIGLYKLLVCSYSGGELTRPFSRNKIKDQYQEVPKNMRPSAEETKGLK